ncbi:hypothetical protein DVH05_001715 [Phytophthora capsici]|nr:hypothetical protein DVH05_001715 [Phytophthora capsici]
MQYTMSASHEYILREIQTPPNFATIRRKVFTVRTVTGTPSFLSKATLNSGDSLILVVEYHTNALSRSSSSSASVERAETISRCSWVRSSFTSTTFTAVAVFTTCSLSVATSSIERASTGI